MKKEVLKQRPTRYRLRQAQRTLEEMVALGIIEEKVSAKGKVVELSSAFKQHMMNVTANPKEYHLDEAKTAEEYLHMTAFAAIMIVLGKKVPRRAPVDALSRSLSRYISMVQVALLREVKSANDDFDEWRQAQKGH